MKNITVLTDSDITTFLGNMSPGINQPVGSYSGPSVMFSNWSPITFQIQAVGMTLEILSPYSWIMMNYLPDMRLVANADSLISDLALTDYAVYATFHDTQQTFAQGSLQFPGPVTIAGTIQIDQSSGPLNITGPVTIPNGVEVSNFPATFNVTTASGDTVTIAGTINIASNQTVGISGVATVEFNGTQQVEFPSSQSVTIDTSGGAVDVSVSGDVTLNQSSTSPINISGPVTIPDGVAVSNFPATFNVTTASGDTVTIAGTINIASNQTVGISGVATVEFNGTQQVEFPSAQSVSVTEIVDTNTNVLNLKLSTNSLVEYAVGYSQTFTLAAGAETQLTVNTGGIIGTTGLYDGVIVFMSSAQSQVPNYKLQGEFWYSSPTGSSSTNIVSPFQGPDTLNGNTEGMFQILFTQPVLGNNLGLIIQNDGGGSITDTVTIDVYFIKSTMTVNNQTDYPVNNQAVPATLAAISVSGNISTTNGDSVTVTLVNAGGVIQYLYVSANWDVDQSVSLDLYNGSILLNSYLTSEAAGLSVFTCNFGPGIANDGITLTITTVSYNSADSTEFGVSGNAETF